MKRGILGIICIMSSALTPAFATTYQLQSGPAIEYSLPPHTPQEFSNVFMWKVKASCKILTQEDQVPIAFTVLRKKGSVDSVNMSAGDPSITLLFHPNQKVDIVAEPGGIVRLENLGEKTISASCSTN